MIKFRPRRILVAAMLSVPAGGGVEVFTVNWATTLQQEIPPEKLSRRRPTTPWEISRWPCSYPR
jgi:hypothetical protein